MAVRVPLASVLAIGVCHWQAKSASVPRRLTPALADCACQWDTMRDTVHGVFREAVIGPAFMPGDAAIGDFISEPRSTGLLVAWLKPGHIEKPRETGLGMSRWFQENPP